MAPSRNDEVRVIMPTSETRKLRRAARHVRRREEAQQHQRLAAGVARHVPLAARNEHDVARLDVELAAFSNRGAGALEHVDALLVSVVHMRTARLVAGL